MSERDPDSGARPEDSDRTGDVDPPEAAPSTPSPGGKTGGFDDAPEHLFPFHAIDVTGSAFGGDWIDPEDTKPPPPKILDATGSGFGADLEATGSGFGGNELDRTGSGYEDEDPSSFLLGRAPDVAEIPAVFARDLLGRVIGGCVLETMIGRGAMGIVFRGRHQALDKALAVKILNPSLFYLRRHVDQFFREARAAAALEHPHVVTVHSVGQERGIYFILMQLVEGESLAERIERQTRLTVAETIRVGIETGQALFAAHRRGIIHRDVKPANLLLDADDRVKVADFGLAGRCVTASEARGRAEVMGTPYYIPPEQIAGGAVDQRADLYSLGVTLYYAAAGRRPFEGDTPRDIFVKHLTAQPVPLDQAAPDVPAALAEIIHRLLAKKPDARYPDAAALVRDLAGLAGALS